MELCVFMEISDVSMEIRDVSMVINDLCFYGDQLLMFLWWSVTSVSMVISYLCFYGDYLPGFSIAISITSQVFAQTLVASSRPIRMFRFDDWKPRCILVVHAMVLRLWKPIMYMCSPNICVFMSLSVVHKSPIDLHPQTTFSLYNPQYTLRQQFSLLSYFKTMHTSPVIASYSGIVHRYVSCLCDMRHVYVMFMFKALAGTDQFVAVECVCWKFPSLLCDNQNTSL